MATDPKVKREILRRLRISEPTLSQRAKGIKNSFGPMTTEEAHYVIAHIEGIDLSKYLPIVTLDRVRSLVPREIQPSKPQTRPQKRVKQLQKVSYPLATNAQITMANDLGKDVYPELFVLENSIRTLIIKQLEALNTNWWDSGIYVSPQVKKNVSRTMNKEKRYPYREPRGSHPISYANFADLSTIVLENKPVFQNIIFDFEWFRVKMDEVYMARNNLAHCVSLPKDDVTRIHLFFRDWATLLKTAGY